MYSILLVEDEKKILDGLYSIVESSGIGFGRIDTAQDGAKALEMCREQLYDVVLTDIRMPKMDGLEFMRHLREEKRAMRVIFVTAFGEFDYVLQALRLGGTNFITKPINKAELSESIKAALDTLPRQPSPPEAPEEGREQKTLRDYFLKRWTSGYMDNLESTLRAQMADVSLFLAEYNVVLFRPLCSEAEGMAEEIESRLQKRWQVWRYRNQRVQVLILGGQGANAREIGKVLSEYLDEGIACKRWFCVIGFGVRRYQEVSMTYQTSMKRLNYPNSYMIGALCEASANMSLQAPAECGISGEELLETEEDRRAIELLRRSGLCKHTLFPPIAGLLHLLEERYFQSVEDTNRILIELLRAWDEPGSDTLAAEKAVLEARRLRKDKQAGMSPIIVRTLEIVAGRYAGSMRLKELSKELNVHPNYLGYLFKKETGRFFSDYLNEMRMQKAEERLKHTTESISEIARQVGYGDVRYFNQAFKLRNGMTPGKYRLMVRGPVLDAPLPRKEK